LSNTIVKELKIGVEHGKVVTTLNIVKTLNITFCVMSFILGARKGNIPLGGFTFQGNLSSSLWREISTKEVLFSNYPDPKGEGNPTHTLYWFLVG
jgi:hypothetical protein